MYCHNLKRVVDSSVSEDDSELAIIQTLGLRSLSLITCGDIGDFLSLLRAASVESLLEGIELYLIKAEDILEQLAIFPALSKLRWRSIIHDESTVSDLVDAVGNLRNLEYNPIGRTWEVDTSTVGTRCVA